MTSASQACCKQRRKMLTRRMYSLAFCIVTKQYHGCEVSSSTLNEMHTFVQLIFYQYIQYNYIYKKYVFIMLDPSF